jgi:hypothetical protein
MPKRVLTARYLLITELTLRGRHLMVIIGRHLPPAQGTRLRIR